VASSRRGSERWAAHAAPTTPRVEVLIPTAGRRAELAVTLAGLASQDDPDFAVVISDQSTERVCSSEPSVRAMVRLLEAQGRHTRVVHHETRRGIAEHRQFLLDQSSAQYVLFLDDDVWLEPGQLQRLTTALDILQCGFVGAAVQGLSYLDDERPDQQGSYESWSDFSVMPETIRKDSPEFARWALHNAANLTHITRGLSLPEGLWVPYKIAWIGGCVLYRRDLLVEAGGFNFWRDLPDHHSGEDVAVQWRLMEMAGGAGILPSGAVHLEAPTTIPVREVDAPDIVFAPTEELRAT
jgi:GT2 family glycosyltransferase